MFGFGKNPVGQLGLSDLSRDYLTPTLVTSTDFAALATQFDDIILHCGSLFCGVQLQGLQEEEVWVWGNATDFLTAETPRVKPPHTAKPRSVPPHRQVLALSSQTVFFYGVGMTLNVLWAGLSAGLHDGWLPGDHPSVGSLPLSSEPTRLASAWSSEHVLLDSGNASFALGGNRRGQLGVGDKEDRPTLARVAGGGMEAVTTGTDVSFWRSADRAYVFAAGSDSGRGATIGLGDGVDRVTPTLIPSLSSRPEVAMTIESVSSSAHVVAAMVQLDNNHRCTDHFTAPLDIPPRPCVTPAIVPARHAVVLSATVLQGCVGVVQQGDKDQVIRGGPFVFPVGRYPAWEECGGVPRVVCGEVWAQDPVNVSVELGSPIEKSDAAFTNLVVSYFAKALDLTREEVWDVHVESLSEITVVLLPWRQFRDTQDLFEALVAKTSVLEQWFGTSAKFSLSAMFTVDEASEGRSGGRGGGGHETIIMAILITCVAAFLLIATLSFFILRAKRRQKTPPPPDVESAGQAGPKLAHLPSLSTLDVTSHHNGVGVVDHGGVLSPEAATLAVDSPTCPDDSQETSDVVPSDPSQLVTLPARTANYSVDPMHSPSEGELIVGEQMTWKRGKLIGQGGAGAVYTGLDTVTGNIIAVKELLLDDDSDPEALMRETKVLQGLRHPHVVCLLGADVIDQTVYIYLEYVSGGSLATMLKQFGRFPMHTLANYSRQALQGLDYLHSENVIHRDIKPSNILVTHSGEVRIADFGTARLADHRTKMTMQGTPAYMAPEVMQPEALVDRSSDIWSLGCTVLNLATNKGPWARHTFDHQMSLMFFIAWSPDAVPKWRKKTLPATLNHFLHQTLQRNASLRPSASWLLEHPWLIDQELSPDLQGEIGPDSTATQSNRSGSEAATPRPLSPRSVAKGTPTPQTLTPKSLTPLPLSDS